VFLPGAGSVGLDYALVADAVSKVTTAVLYDRGGTGWSDAVDLPRKLDDVSDELRALIRVVCPSGPIVLVGHSLGAVYARHFAQRHTAEVAAVVLLDPAHEDNDKYMPPELLALRRGRGGADDGLPAEPPEIVADFYRSLFGAALEQWPPLLRDALVEAHSSRDWVHAGMVEASNIAALLQQVRRAGPLPDVPTKILSSTDVDDFRRAVLVGESDELLQAEIKAKYQLYFELASQLTRGETRVVESGHVTMPFVEPEAVAKAITDAVEAAREDERRGRPSR
jgi:pimeloyl-ACP methyl ester carboxylesterase